MSSEASDLNDHSSETDKPLDPVDIQGTKIGNDDSNDQSSDTSKPLDSADIRGTEIGKDAIFLGNPGLDNTGSDAQPLAKIGAIAEKEKAGVYFITNPDGEEEAMGDDDPRLDGLSKYVRKIVDFHDDPNLPTLTFRYFLLSIFFIVPGAFLSQMSHFRTTSAPYSVFFVQIASNYVGVWLANILPAWEAKVPFTKWSFNLNPGPFSVKEHVLVTISAASGATYNLGFTPIAMSELYLGEVVHPAKALFFMWAIVFTGYSYAALARQFLIYDPQYPWFYALCQTALFNTQKKQRENPSPVSRKQTKVFWLVLLFIILWQFLPEYAFPMVGSLSLICWVAPQNATANFLGAGFGGMSLLNLSFDWSSISVNTNLFLTPWWTQVLMFAAFVFNCWILLPAAKFGGMGQWHLKLMSNRLFTANGTAYPYTDLLTPQNNFNETAYEIDGPIYAGTQFLWALFFDYASYTSALSWVALFGYSQIRTGLKNFMDRRNSNRGKNNIAEQYTDQLNVIQRAYPEVPYWWFVALFMFSFVSLITVISIGLFIPVWTYFVAIATGAIVVVPLGWLYALSNFQLPIGSTNEVLYGLMVNAVSGHKNPAGSSTYGSIAGDAWYRAQLNLQDMKIGHYMHVPPRAVFFSQVFGATIGVPINYGVVRWVLNTKSQYLSGAEIDPTHQWTGQALASYLSLGVQYVLIGPKRLFSESLYRPLPYGFLVGAVAPLFLFTIHKLGGRHLKFLKINLWNTTIFFSCMSNFYGNVSTGYTSSFIGGFVVMYWAFRYRYDLWARWNYLLGAAFDAGFNFNMLLIFLFFGAGKIVTMPSWWGNDPNSSERCFALSD